MAKKKKTAKRSTALARRAHAPRPTKIEVINQPPAPAPLEPRRNTLTDDIALGDFGLVTDLKFTPEEEKVLSRPVDVNEIRIKPSGQPYLSHPTYTRWFNDAFGRLGWQLVPSAKPMVSKGSVVQPYVLHIHGRPVAYAMGEQEYFESNKDQSYGDALEATHASALRRCAKHLGIGLELWDKQFIEQYVAQHCVQVWTNNKSRDGKSYRAKRWRRRVDIPFWNEAGAVQPGQRFEDEEETQRRAPERRPPARQSSSGHHGASGAVISEGQQKRLWAIIRNSGRDEEQIRSWLSRRFGWDSTKKITRDEYDYVCSAIESPAALPEADHE